MIRGKIHGGVAYSCVGCAPANHAIPVIGCGYRPRLTALINGLGSLCRTSASGGNQPTIVTSLFRRVWLPNSGWQIDAPRVARA